MREVNANREHDKMEFQQGKWIIHPIHGADVMVGYHDSETVLLEYADTYVKLADCRPEPHPPEQPPVEPDEYYLNHEHGLHAPPPLVDRLTRRIDTLEASIADGDLWKHQVLLKAEIQGRIMVLKEWRDDASDDGYID